MTERGRLNTEGTEDGTRRAKRKTKGLLKRDCCMAKCEAPTPCIEDWDRNGSE